MAAAAGGFDWRTLVSGLSSMIPVYQQQQAARRQQADLEAGQQAALQKQYQADNAIGNTVSSVASSTPTAPQEHSLANYTMALQRLRNAPSTSIANVGGARYKAGVDNANTAVANYGGRQALDLSQLAGAERQREGEGVARADLSSNLTTLGNAGNTDLYLSKLKAAREQPNPWLNLLGTLGQRIGRNYLFKNERIGTRKPGFGLGTGLDIGMDTPPANPGFDLGEG